MLLFAIRWQLGALFGWDSPRAGLAGRVRSLVERLPDDLHQPVTGTPAAGRPSPLLVLFVAAGLLLLAAQRSRPSPAFRK